MKAPSSDFSSDVQKPAVPARSGRSTIVCALLAGVALGVPLGAASLHSASERPELSLDAAREACRKKLEIELGILAEDILTYHSYRVVGGSGWVRRSASVDDVKCSGFLSFDESDQSVMSPTAPVCTSSLSFDDEISP